MSTRSIASPISSPTSSCCEYCQFRSSTKILLVKHLFESHSQLPSFKFKCCIDDCVHSFSTGSTYVSFLGHVNRKHAQWQSKIYDSDAAVSLSDTSSVGSDHISDSLDANDDYQDIPVLTASTIDRPTFSEEFSNPKRLAALFILSLKEHNRVTQKAIDFTVHSIEEVVENTFETLMQSIQDSYEQKGTLNLDDIRSCFGSLPKPFSELQQFGLVVSEK